MFRPYGQRNLPPRLELGSCDNHTIVPSWGNAMFLFAEIMAASLFILLFGEFLPKAIFRAKSNSLLSFFARTMEFLNKLLFPISAFFAAFAQWILKYIFNVRMDERKETFSVTDLDRFLQQTRDTEEDCQRPEQNSSSKRLGLPSQSQGPRMPRPP